MIYIRTIKDIYEGLKTSVRTSIGDIKYFPIDIRLHQGLALSSFLFTIIMHDLTRVIQNAVPWCMFFADNIVLIDKTRDGLNYKLVECRYTLEFGRF